MNAIISLAHFCELHGPRIVFITQAFRDPPSLECIRLSGYQVDDASTTRVATKEAADSECCWKYGRSSVQETLKSQSNFLDTCSACSSFPHNKAALISNDDESRVSFVSSQYPLQEEIFTLLRQAGIRSLSCEVYSEREGPIYFGDHARGHVISYTFFLKDIQARGFNRRYSILVMMADKMFLLNSWSFFIKYIQEIIKSLQDAASKVYFTEKTEENDQSGLRPPAPLDNSKRHRAAGNPRPLTDLVGNKSIWNTLHTRFSWILKSGGMRLQEKLIEGPTLFIPQPTNCRTTLQSLLDLLSAHTVRKLLHHVYIGNRIVFQCSDRCLLQDFLQILKPVIPHYLYHPLDMPPLIGNSPPVFEGANIITITSALDTAAVPYAMCVKIGNKVESECLELQNEMKKEIAQGAIIQVVEPSPIESRPPQIVTKMLSLIEKGNFSPSLLNLYFATLIDEWTNKVKIWSFLTKDKNAMSSTQIQSLKHVNPAGLQIPEKRGLLSRSPSPTPSVGCVNSMLTVVGALECDIPMLMALSDAFERFGQS